MGRLAVNEFTFSDGTTVPAGTTLSVPVGHIHLDPETYEDPKRFDGFRFIKMKERAAADGHPDKKFDMVSTSLQSLAFSHGRHACPGRFFAAVEVKLMLACVVMTYDVKMVDCVRPPEKWLMHNRVQDDTVEVLFRKRRDEPEDYHTSA
jgi:cytochrome P450